MRTITRTEITVESREVLSFNRRGSLFQSWCGDCGEKVGVLRVEEAALAGVSLEAICRGAETDKLHLIELADGLSFLCLNSLVNQF